MIKAVNQGTREQETRKQESSSKYIPTTRLPDHQTTRPPDYQTTRPPDYPTTFMPLNYPQLQSQIIELGKTSKIREDRLQVLRERAKELLADRTQDVDALHAKVERAVEQNPNLRCALPVSEPLTASYPLPEIPTDIALLAADGSQINPDNHTGANYYLVNVGGILLNLNQPAAPETFVESKLKYGDALYTQYGSVSSGHVALERDLAERKYLAQRSGEYLARYQNSQNGTLSFTRLRRNAENAETKHKKTKNPRESASKIPPLMITLTDGPLELWGIGDTSGKDSRAVQEIFEDYKETLHQLLALGAITAGYVDKPQADLVVRLLEVARLDEDHLSEAGRNRVFRGVSDADLFTPLLKPGERSAVFGIQSRTRAEYAHDLALHFFYLNIGYANHPRFARVEIPAWVAKNPPQLDTLHAVLIQQCQTLGANGYPYLLHRSHEIAVVTYEEKDLLTDMINQERRRLGIPTSRTSNKQNLKNLDGRTSIK